jgi:hypothetical protein
MPRAAGVSPARPPGSRFPRPLRFPARAAAVLFLLPLSVAAVLYILCLTNPDIVATEAQKLLVAATGLPFRIRGGLRPVLLPAPGLEISDVLIAAPGREGDDPGAEDKIPARARTVGIYPDLPNLLRGRLRIGRVEFYKPAVNLALDGENGLPLPPRPEENTENSDPAGLRPAPDEGRGSPVASGEPAEDGPDRDGVAVGEHAEEGPDRVGVASGDAPENAGNGGSANRETRLKMLKAAAGLLLAPPGEGMPSVVVREGRLFIYTGQGGRLLGLQEINGAFSPAAEGDNFNISAALALPDADLALRFSLAAGIGRASLPARGRVGGALVMSPPGSREIAARFSSGFSWSADGSVLDLPGLSLSSEGDALRADLRVDLAAPECTGKVTLDRLSLIRWFGFGRVLPPGLRQALHSMRGEFDLLLDGGKAEAHNLTAEAGDLRLQGYVGAPDFSAPAVVVRAALQGRADIDRIFPFLGVAGEVLPVPRPPVFDHPPLAPYPAGPAAPDGPADEEMTVGYDINIHADEILLHGVEGGPLDVRVHPAPDGSNRTRVGIRAEGLLRGRADGYIDVDAEALRMRYTLADAELGLLPENSGGGTRIAGTATGVCEMDLPMSEDGTVADDWPLRADLQVNNMKISGRFRNKEWFLLAGSAAGKGVGSIHAVPEKGVVISGDWNLDARALQASWNPGGDDSLKGNFAGALVWPPMSPDPAEGDGAKEQHRAVERVEGKISLTGAATLPALLVPLKGKMTADILWHVREENLQVKKAVFEGMGSHAETTASVDFSGAALSVRAAPSFKLSPREMLAVWKIALPEAARAPEVFSGRTDIFVDGQGLRLEKIRVEADSSSLSGDIAVSHAPFADGSPGGRRGGGGAGAVDPAARELWTVRLYSEHLDMDGFFPPGERHGRPETARTAGSKARAGGDRRPDLSFVKGLAADVRIQAGRLRKSGLTAEDAVFTAVLRNNAFSLRFTTDKFYGGACDIDMEGAVQPDSRVRLQRGGLRLRGAALDRLMGDYAGDRSCAGTTDLDMDLHGLFTPDSGFPAELSGTWSLRIRDGMYPAFFSGPDSHLRNTFSHASASGPLDRGVLRSDNFTLGGPMVDMKGGGWYDINTRDLDILVSVTFAKVPTLPVQFYGNADSPRMNIHGVDMVLETMQAAGSGLFGLIRGVLELPAKAVTGIGSLFESDGVRKRQMPRKQKPEAGKAPPSDKVPVRGSTMPVRRPEQRQ